MDFDSDYVNSLNQANVERNKLDGKNMYKNGQLTATQKPGIFPNTTSTIDNGHKVAETKENVINGKDIIQDGERTGFIKEDQLGNTSLYDTDHTKLAYIDPNGNVREIFNHSDPLSQVQKYK